jgi:hypothetical protein
MPTLIERFTAAWKLNTDVQRFGQLSLWDESEHPRETTTHTDDHGLKKPGEFAPKKGAKTFMIWDAIPEKNDKKRMLEAIYRRDQRGRFIAELDAIARSEAGALQASGLDPMQELEKPTNYHGQNVADCLHLIYELMDLDPETAERGQYGEDGEPEFEEEAMQIAYDFITWGPGEDIPSVSGTNQPDIPEFQGAFPEPLATRNYKTRLKNAPKITPEQGQQAIAKWKQAALEAGENEDNSNKVIISLFDYTGTWSQPWRDAGYQVIQMDLKLGMDFLTSSYLENLIDEMQGSIAGVLSACPCITFTRTGSQWWPKRHDMEDPEKLEQVFGPSATEAINPKTGKPFRSAKEYNIGLYEYSKSIVERAKPGWHALENPATGRFHQNYGKYEKATDIGKPRMVFDPNNFGDAYTKETGIWGDFSVELPTANVEATEGSKMQSKLSGSHPVDRVMRSITPDGFAYAFFMAQHYKN